MSDDKAAFDAEYPLSGDLWSARWDDDCEGRKLVDCGDGRGFSAQPQIADYIIATFKERDKFKAEMVAVAKQTGCYTRTREGVDADLALSVAKLQLKLETSDTLLRRVSGLLLADRAYKAKRELSDYLSGSTKHTSQEENPNV